MVFQNSKAVLCNIKQTGFGIRQNQFKVWPSNLWYELKDIIWLLLALALSSMTKDVNTISKGYCEI